MSEQESVIAPGAQGERTFWERVWGALTLDATVFNEVEHDREAIGQAAGLVALTAVAEVIGLGFSLGVAFSAFIGWIVSAAAVWIVGVKILEHNADFQELLRTIGFATAPRLALVLGIVLGPLRAVLWAFVLFLVAVAFVVAVRQALNIPTGRAVFVCAVAAILNLIPSLFLGGAAWL